MPIYFYHKCQFGVLPCWMLSSERPGNILIISEKDHEIYVSHFIQIGSMSAVSKLRINDQRPQSAALFLKFESISIVTRLRTALRCIPSPPSIQNQPWAGHINCGSGTDTSLSKPLCTCFRWAPVWNSFHQLLMIRWHLFFAKMETSCAGKAL